MVFGANYLSDTWALRDYLLWDTFYSRMLIESIFKRFFFNSWDLFFFPVCSIQLKENWDIYDHGNKREHYEDARRKVNNLSPNFLSHFLPPISSLWTWPELFHIFRPSSQKYVQTDKCIYQVFQFYISSLQFGEKTIAAPL